MKAEAEVIVVGAGVAGLAAAELLGRHRVRTLVVDENPCPGGQLLRRWPAVAFDRRRDIDRAKNLGNRLLEQLQQQSGSSRVSIMANTQAVGFFPPGLLLLAAGQEALGTASAPFIIFAPGAREKFLPFPGWTLPGVISTGGLQILAKNHGLVPATAVTVAGRGPLPLLAASQVAALGGKIRALLLEPTLTHHLTILRHCQSSADKLIEGAVALLRLLRHRILPQCRTRVIEARGRSQLEEVIAARIDRTGKAVPGTERVHASQWLAVGHGFSPNVELPAQAGCRLKLQRDRAGWGVAVDAEMQTSVANLFAAGEVTGIGGGLKSYLEGRLAAAAILYRLGQMRPSHYRRQAEQLRRRRQGQIAYGRFVNGLGMIPRPAYDQLPDDTLVCRCEDITLGQVRAALQQGFTTINALKRRTRCAMGRCQGRICAPILTDLIYHHFGKVDPLQAMPSFRAPIKPVPLGQLADMGEEVHL